MYKYLNFLVIINILLIANFANAFGLECWGSSLRNANDIRWKFVGVEENRTPQVEITFPNKNPATFDCEKGSMVDAGIGTELLNCPNITDGQHKLTITLLKWRDEYHASLKSQVQMLSEKCDIYK